MKFYTWCNVEKHPKLEILEKSAKSRGIEISVLGSGIKWTRNFQKIGLLLEAIKNLNSDEIIVCTDAFDVLYLADAVSIEKSFINLLAGANMKDIDIIDRPIVFSAERLYRHHNPKYKSYWDSINSPFGYRYLNSGTFIGYQLPMIKMLNEILRTATARDYIEGNDQKLFAEYAIKNPGKVLLDYRCELFWCPSGEQEILGDLYQINAPDTVAIVGTDGPDSPDSPKHFLVNLKTRTTPCFIHITHKKEFYGLLLKIATELEYISQNDADKYLKIHKTELANKEMEREKEKEEKKRLLLLEEKQKDLQIREERQKLEKRLEKELTKPVNTNHLTQSMNKKDKYKPEKKNDSDTVQKSINSINGQKKQPKQKHKSVKKITESAEETRRIGED